VERKYARELRAIYEKEAKAYQSNATRGLYRPPPTSTLTKAVVAKTGLSGSAGASICVNRQSRAEVMHATGRAGKVGQKTPVWTKKSKVRCV